jgi:hypothetical protein
MVSRSGSGALGWMVMIALLVGGRTAVLMFLLGF